MHHFKYFLKSWSHPWRRGTVPAERNSYTFDERAWRIYLLLELGAPYPILRNEMRMLDRTFRSLPAEQRLMLSLES